MKDPVTPNAPSTSVVSSGFFKKRFSMLKIRLHKTPKIPKIISPDINPRIKGNPAAPSGFIEP